MNLRWLYLLIGVWAWGVSSCCQLNHLADRADGIKTVSFEMEIVEEPTVRFLRHERYASEFVVRPGPRTGYSETRYAEVLAMFAAAELQTQLSKQAPDLFLRRLGWHVPPDGRKPDAVMVLTVEDYSLTAQDAQSGVSMEWHLRAVLMDGTSGEPIWRDCLDWQLPGVDLSMEELARLDDSSRSVHLEEAAGGLLEELAGTLAGAVRYGSL
jgi:hypothetical protein